MNKWSHVSWKRVAAALLVVLGATWVIVFGMKLLTPWYTAREMFRHDSSVRLMPTSLSDQSLAPLKGNRIEVSGISFETPWNEPPVIKSEKTLAIVAFPKRGAGMLLFVPSDLENYAGMIQKDPEMVRLLGKDVTNSNYQLMAAEMAVTPDQVKWWKPPRQNARIFYLLAMKSMFVGDSKSLSTVSFGEMRGFQQGNLTTTPRRVRLDLFDSRDQHLGIQISAKSGLPLSQAEVNAIVASIRLTSVN
jgi:hypothetical protein